MKDRKFRISTLGNISMIVTVIFSVLIFTVMVWAHREFVRSQQCAMDYAECENAKDDLEAASRYLTEQVRMYVKTGEARYLDAYFEEVNYKRRREKAISLFESKVSDTETVEHMKTALMESDALMYSEYYAMKLTSQTLLAEPCYIPPCISNIELTADELAADDAGKLIRAMEYVQNDSYRIKAEEIINEVAISGAKLLSLLKAEEEKAVAHYKTALLIQNIGIFILVVFLVINSVVNRNLVIVPLRKYVSSVKNGQTFPIEGAAELRILAENYNVVFNENEEIRKILKYDADHDALTDIWNRGAFNRILSSYANSGAPYALLVVDVDIFKSINDNYGHDTGDQILRKVAKVLLHTFKGTDFPCRIGGDEFAIIMPRTDSSARNSIVKKINRINDILLNPEDELPEISISVGVAFSDCPVSTGNLYRDADQALYIVKANGRCGCRVYG